jgi:hypothetical protein
MRGVSTGIAAAAITTLGPLGRAELFLVILVLVGIVLVVIVTWVFDGIAIEVDVCGGTM